MGTVLINARRHSVKVKREYVWGVKKKISFPFIF